MNCQLHLALGVDVVRQLPTHRSQVPILGCQPLHKRTMVTSYVCELINRCLERSYN